MEGSLLFLSPQAQPVSAIVSLLPDNTVSTWNIGLIRAVLMLNEHAIEGPLLLDYRYATIDGCSDLVEQALQLNLPVVFISEQYCPEQQEKSCQLNAQDYLAPPLSDSVVEKRLHNLYQLNKTTRALTAQNIQIDAYKEEFQQEMAMVQDAAILCLAAMARMRDHSTGNHILRTQHYVKELAEYLRFHPDYREELDDTYSIELLYKSAALHDIGKVGVQDHILQKPGSLDTAEYEEIKKHTLYGYQAMQTAESLLERSGGKYSSRFLAIGKQVTLSHHERWDGCGYPEGLKGKEIPPVARLMAVADVYDAMTSNRPYKDEYTHEIAATMIIDGRGNHFDPVVVDAFIALRHRFEQIALQLQDQFPSKLSNAMNSEISALTSD